MNNPPVATEMIAAQINAMDSELEQLDRQIAHYQARREAVVLMKKALEPLIPKAGSSAPAGGSETVKPVPVPSSVPRTGNTGFREALRDVLRDNPKGLKPREVVQELEARGDLAKYTGTVEPSVRVHNELYSLRKRGSVLRRSGRYSLATENGNAVT